MSSERLSRIRGGNVVGVYFPDKNVIRRMFLQGFLLVWVHDILVFKSPCFIQITTNLNRCLFQNSSCNVFYKSCLYPPTLIQIFRKKINLITRTHQIHTKEIFRIHSKGKTSKICQFFFLSNIPQLKYHPLMCFIILR